MLQNKEKLITLLDKLSEWSIYILIFCLPFSKTIIEITITVAFMCVLSKKVIKKEKLLALSPINISLIVLSLAILPSFINTENFALSAKALVSKNLKFYILAAMIPQIINSRTKLKNLLIMAGLAGIITVLNGYIQYYVTHVDLLHNYTSFKYVFSFMEVNKVFFTYSYIGFPTASFPYPNDFGAWLIMYLLPLAAVVFIYSENIRKRVLLTLCFVSFCYLLILTKARAAWLGFFSGIAFLSIFKLKKIAIIMISLSFILYLGINKKVGGYVMQFTSISDRAEMWKTGWKIFEKHPVVGNGINSFFEQYKQTRTDEFQYKRGSYAHNCYLQMASDVGVVGLGAFLCFLYVFFSNLLVRTKKLRVEFYKVLSLGVLAGIFGFLIHSFFDTNLYSLPLAALFWFFVGTAQSVVAVVEAG